MKVQTDKMKKILRLLATLNDTMIAAQVGCSKEYARSLRKQHGVDSGVRYMRSKQRIDEKLMGDAIKKYTETQMPLCEIAKITRSSIPILVSELKQMGVYYKGRKTSKTKKSGFATWDKNALSAMTREMSLKRWQKEKHKTQQEGK